MSALFIFYRKVDGHISGFVGADGCPESEAVELVDSFLEQWCGKRCDTRHGIPVFVGVPFIGSGNESILNVLPRKLRGKGFEPHLRSIDVRNGKK